MKRHQRLVLTIGLTPHFMSQAALRKKISKYAWARLRRDLLRERGQVCEICGFTAQESRLIAAHEVYEYPEGNTIQMTGIQLLCTRCHDVKDFAHTLRLISMGIYPKSREGVIIEHFCTVNGCTRKDFERHYDQAVQYMHELEERYGACNDGAPVRYGQYRGLVSQAAKRKNDPSRFNWWTALQRAVELAVGKGAIHPDCREVVIELAREDADLRNEILEHVRRNDRSAAIARITEALTDFADSEAPWDPLPDHELVYAPGGDLYGHRGP